jgi:ABC-type nitrate/sulfonate/bicarbonate transport system substrate-binding protein
MKIGGVPEHFNYPWHYALEEGLFFDRDIDIEWIDYPGGSGAMAQDLREGTIDMALMLTEGAITAIANGLSAKIVQYYVESPLLWGIHADGQDPRNELSEFTSPRFAISRRGSGSHLMSYVDALKRDSDPSVLNFVEVGTLDGALTSLSKKESDLFLWEKFTTKPYVDNGQLKLIDVRPTPWPCFVWVVRTETLINDSERVQAVQDAMQVSISKVRKQKDLAEVISKRYELRESDVKEWLSTTKWSKSTKLKYGPLKEVMNTLYDLKLISSQPKEEELIFSY